MLNKVKEGSNMYQFLNDYPKKDSNKGYTWNPIKGCKYDCSYCYVKSLSKRYGFSLEPRIDEKCFKDNLGENNFIFVGSVSDMFGGWVPKEWILKVLEHCRKFPKNLYLFQTKNPKRFLEFVDDFPKNTVLGTTIETDKKITISKAPQPVLWCIKGW